MFSWDLEAIRGQSDPFPIYWPPMSERNIVPQARTTGTHFDPLLKVKSWPSLLWSSIISSKKVSYNFKAIGDHLDQNPVVKWWWDLPQALQIIQKRIPQNFRIVGDHLVLFLICWPSMSKRNTVSWTWLHNKFFSTPCRNVIPWNYLKQLQLLSYSINRTSSRPFKHKWPPLQLLQT